MPTRQQRIDRERGSDNPNYKKIQELQKGIELVKNHPVGEGCKWSHCAYGCCGEGKCEKGCKECCDQPEPPSYKKSQVVPVHEMHRGGRRTRKKRKRRSMCARLTNKACKSKRYKKRCKTTRRKRRGSKGRKSHCRTRRNRYAKRPNRKRKKQKGGGLLRDIGLGDAVQGYYSGVEMIDNARNRWAGKRAETPSNVIKQPKMMRAPEAQYNIPNVPDYYSKASVQAAKHMLK